MLESCAEWKLSLEGTLESSTGKRKVGCSMMTIKDLVFLILPSKQVRRNHLHRTSHPEISHIGTLFLRNAPNKSREGL